MVDMTTTSVTPASLPGQRLLDAWNSFEPANQVPCRKRTQRVHALLQTLKSSLQHADVEKMRDLRAKLVNEATLAKEVDTCLAALGGFPTEGPVHILPQKAWQLIFSFLNARKDYLNFMLVCRQWAVFAKDPKMLARMLERGCLGRVPSSHLHKFLQQCEKEVRLSNLPGLRTKWHLSQLQKLLQQCGSEVRTLDLPGLLTEADQNQLNNENLSALLRTCPSLQSLSIVNRLKSVEELCEILVATGIAKTLCNLYVADCPEMHERGLQALTQCCPNLKPENVHYENYYYRTGYFQLVEKGVPLARCLTLTEEEKKTYHDKCTAVYFLVCLGFDMDHLFQQPALLDIYSGDNRQGALLSLIKFGISPSILRSLPPQTLKYLFETIHCYGDLKQIAQHLPSLDPASFKLVLDHSSAIKDLMFWGMDFEDFSDLTYELRCYVLQHQEDFESLIRTFGVYNNFTLATFLQIPEGHLKIIIKAFMCSISTLLDEQGEPFEAMLQLDRETFEEVFYHWSHVSEFLRLHGSAKLAKVYQLPVEQRKVAITNLHGLAMLILEGMTIEAVQDAAPESIEYILRHRLAAALLLKLGISPKEIFHMPFIGKPCNWENWMSGISVMEEWRDGFHLISQRVMDVVTADNGWYSDLGTKLVPYLEPGHASRQWILENFMSVVFILQRGCAMPTIVKLNAQELEIVCNNFDAFQGRMRIPLSQYDMKEGWEQKKEMFAEIVSHIFRCHFVNAETLPTDREVFADQNKRLPVADVLVLQQEGISLDRFVELNPDRRQKALAHLHELKWHIRDGLKFDDFFAMLEERQDARFIE